MIVLRTPKRIRYLVPLSTRRDGSRPVILRSPVWDGALRQAQVALDDLAGADQPQYSRSPTLARESASAVLARAHAQLISAVGATRAQGRDTVSELVGAAVALVRVVYLLWSTHAATGYEDRLPLTAHALERQLSAHEHSVLSGELTYSLSIADAEQPAMRMRHSLAELATHGDAPIGDLLSVHIAAIELASLLVRAAGNVVTDSHADEASDGRTSRTDEALLRVADEIGARAQTHLQDLGPGDYVVGRCLAWALRECESARPPETGAVDERTLLAARDAWLEVAALEHAVVAALDAKLTTPAYRAHHETLVAAITQPAAELLCDARLITRPDAFRHDEAWRKQTIALSYAREIHLNGLPGASDGLERAHRVVLTRLVRSTVAITLIDLRGDFAQSDNPQSDNSYPLVQREWRR